MTNRIKIPSRLQNLDEIKSPLLKNSIAMNLEMILGKKKNLSISSKIPNFIKKSQIKKNASFDICSPITTKISMVTANDRSFTNVSQNSYSNSYLKN